MVGGFLTTATGGSQVLFSIMGVPRTSDIVNNSVVLALPYVLILSHDASVVSAMCRQQRNHCQDILDLDLDVGNEQDTDLQCNESCICLPGSASCHARQCLMSRRAVVALGPSFTTDPVPILHLRVIGHHKVNTKHDEVGQYT